MIYSKIKISILIVALFLVGCGKRYDSSIHKPKVRFKPSQRALDRLRYETMGHPYVWGAENDGCYDCSGLTYYTFGSMGIEIPRVANDQFHSGKPVSIDELQKGDLVFFATSKRRPGVATHVGIYIGDGKFQHASSSKKRVVVSSLYEPYYRNHYIGARRYYNFNNRRYRPSYQEYRVAQSSRRVDTSKSYQNSLALKSNNSNSSKNLFAQANSSAPSSYYILLHTSPSQTNEIVTKLELSGLQSLTTQGGGTILVGPFSTKSEAMQVKNYNPNLLANATIRSL